MGRSRIFLLSLKKKTDGHRAMVGEPSRGGLKEYLATGIIPYIHITIIEIR
jgi:hypothetical protein